METIRTEGKKFPPRRPKMFTVPTGQAPAPEIPAVLVPIIEESVKRFEKQLRDGLGMFAATVNMSKWVHNYREEVTRLALDVYARGSNA